MTITNLIPVLRGNGRRRAVDKVADLEAENRTLFTRQMAADGFFALLMNDVVTTNAAWEQEKQLRGEAEEAAAQMRMERDGLADEVAELRRQLAPYLAAEANANRVDVPPMQRDTSALEDQATEPINVKPLWVALGIGPTSAVTDPGHVTTH